MNFSEYQKASYRAIQDHESKKEEVMHWAIGLGEEAGEVLSVIKHRYYAGSFELEDLVGELGDVLWHIAALCTTCNIDLQKVAEYNIAKLNHRYPSGHFDTDRSYARNELDKEFEQTMVARELIEEIARNGGM